jgi:hypothetical protein
LCARPTGELQIAGNITDDRVELRHRDSQTVGRTVVHVIGLKHDRKQGNPVLASTLNLEPPLIQIQLRRAL